MGNGASFGSLSTGDGNRGDSFIMGKLKEDVKKRLSSSVYPAQSVQPEMEVSPKEIYSFERVLWIFTHRAMRERWVNYLVETMNTRPDFLFIQTNCQIIDCKIAENSIYSQMRKILWKLREQISTLVVQGCLANFMNKNAGTDCSDDAAQMAAGLSLKSSAKTEPVVSFSSHRALSTSGNDTVSSARVYSGRDSLKSKMDSARTGIYSTKCSARSEEDRRDMDIGQYIFSLMSLPPTTTSFVNSYYSRSWLRSMVDAFEKLPLAISISSASSNRRGYPFMYINREFEKMFACKRSRVVGHKNWLSFLRRANSHVEVGIEYAMVQGKPYTLPVMRNYRANGEVVESQWFMKPLFDQQGKYRYMVIFHVNLSRQHWADVERRFANELYHYLSGIVIEF
jgi:hypothetical protein